jgi:hypothetical protein
MKMGRAQDRGFPATREPLSPGIGGDHRGCECWSIFPPSPSGLPSLDQREKALRPQMGSGGVLLQNLEPTSPPPAD